MVSVKNKLVLITGATSGIGKACAEIYAQNGANLVITGRRDDRLAKIQKDLEDKYNVKVIPENTIVLSFKLTIGRIAITANKMATNEAIAHFNLIDRDMIYYLYSYLKNFDYSKLGNTSSIATAVNSKIIKAMPISVPNKTMILEFNNKVKPLFEKIKLNEAQNETLEQLRDTLLPKLMNGEIDLDKIEI